MSFQLKKKAAQSSTPVMVSDKERLNKLFNKVQNKETEKKSFYEKIKGLFVRDKKEQGYSIVSSRESKKESEISIKSLKSKVISSVVITSLVMGSMWVMYFLNNYLGNGSLALPLLPRDYSLEGILGILFSWMFHGNWDHLVSNSMVMLPILPAIAFLDRRPYITTLSLLLLSGFIGSLIIFNPAVGASGFIYALMSYIFVSVLSGQSLRYLIVLLMSGASMYFSMKMGLVYTEGVSWGGHFAGLLAGLSYVIIEYKVNKKDRDRGLINI